MLPGAQAIGKRECHINTERKKHSFGRSEAERRSYAGLNEPGEFPTTGPLRIAFRAVALAEPFDQDRMRLPRRPFG